MPTPRILGVFRKKPAPSKARIPTTTTRMKATTGEPPADDSESPRTPEPPVSDEAMAAAQADAEKAKVLQCKEAQDRYQRYIESRRLFRETSDGKRVYLTDQELTEARARAKQAVTDYCS